MPSNYQGGDFTLFATDPRVQVWPQTTFSSFSYNNIAGSATQIVFIETTLAGENQRWLLGANNILSFAIRKDQFGGALLVEISIGDGLLDQAFIFPLTGENVLDTLTGFELGGLDARFTLRNGLGAASDFKGWIQLRSW